MNLRHRLLKLTDRLQAALLALLLSGTTLAFGGGVWWAGTAIAGLTFSFAIACLVRIALERRMPVLKSPLTFLGLLALALATLQLAPLPGSLAEKLSPRSRQAYTLGMFPDRAHAADPGLKLPEPSAPRTPVTLDRSATLRWLAGATVCLTLFWGVSLFTDRLQRLYVVWGSIVAAFFLNTIIGLVQLVSRSGRLFGIFEPGRGPNWAPSVLDLLTTPNAVALRVLAGTAQPPAALMPDRPFLIGSLMGGPGAYLALASLGLPLALALLLQLLAPRGSREGLRARLGDSGQGGLVVLLTGLLLASAALVGLMAGPLLGLTFAIALGLVGLPCARASGLRWTGLAMTVLPMLGLALGVAIGVAGARLPGTLPPVTVEGLETSMRVWADVVPMIRDFPLLGTGLGSFGSIYPVYKSSDEARTTALSSLLQWWVESGSVGMGVLFFGAIWCLWRLPAAVRRVGTADRSLVFGLIGAAVGFSLYSAVHWTIELAALAVAASALGGICDRWLAGGTDLFVERG